MNNNLLNIVLDFYKDYPNVPFISKERDLQKFIDDVLISKSKLVSKKNMTFLEDNILPGHIIILWRIAFETFTTESIKPNMYPKYFEYVYGIDAPKELKKLIALNLVRVENAINSIDYVNVLILKSFLKSKNIAVSKMKKDDVHKAIVDNFSNDELEKLFDVRVFLLTEKGKEMLSKYDFIVDKHPKKKM